MEFPNLFSPIVINNMRLENRIVMTAMHLCYTPGGGVTDRLIDFYRARARGGVGLIIVGGCAIDEYGSMSDMIRIDDDRFTPGLQKLTCAVKGDGARIAAQLYQAGRYTHSSMIGGKKPFSASAVKSTFTGETPRALELDEISQVQNRFVEAAIRAKKAGFDAVEVLGSAGYLISQFFSPLTNLRNDEYGGSMENRMRFGLEIIQKIRKEVGAEYPILMRLAGNDFMERGNTNKEAQIFAKELEKVGVDLFNVTGGWHETRVPQLTMLVPRKGYGYLAQGIKSAVSVPVLMTNRINDPFLAEEIIQNDEADMVTVARGLIADPDFPKKAKEGKAKLIFHCIACNQGCFDSIFAGQPVGCLVNPRAGLERETEISPASQIKRVLVVGGGPAGMKAACVAAQRGHRVTLVEKTNQLGGQLLLNQRIPGREEMVTAAEDLINNLYNSKVDVILEKEADAQFAKELSPDAVILATGARPIIPEIKGFGESKAVLAWDVLAGKAKVGEKVVIIGGNAVGLETAIFLGSQGTISPEVLYFLAANKAETWETLESLINKGNKEVTVVEMENRAGQDIGRSTRWTVLAELRRLGVKVLTSVKATEMTDEGLRIQTENGQDFLPADSVVIAAGSRSENALSSEINGLVPEVYTIGDAKRPAKALMAIKEGFEVGRTI